MITDALKAAIDEMEETLRYMRQFVAVFDDTEQSDLNPANRYDLMSGISSDLYSKASALKIFAATTQGAAWAVGRAVKDAREG